MNLFTHLLITFIGCIILASFLFSNKVTEKRYPAPKVTETCTKEVYYFQDEFGDYIPADRQQFRILFTGQVANAYFYANGKEYSTNTYYKESKAGIQKNGKCIIN